MDKFSAVLLSLKYILYVFSLFRMLGKNEEAAVSVIYHHNTNYLL
jgi:hypothetical protein